MNASLPPIPQNFEDDIALPCIFYKCALPAFHIFECAGNDFYFIGSHIESIIASYVTDLNIHIEEKSFCGNIVIDYNTECKHLSIAGNSQCNDIYIQGNCTCKYIGIKNNGKGICPCIEINNSRVNEMSIYSNVGRLDINNASISLLRLYDCYLHELAWKAGTRGEVYIQGGTINHLNLYQMALLRDVVFSLINVQIYITQLQELLVHGQLIFRNIRSVQEPFTWDPVITKAIEEKKNESKDNTQLQGHYNSMMERLHLIENKYKENVVQLSDKFKIEEKPLFRIVDSSLGKTEITGCDLEAFHFEYRDSKLLETFFSGTKLPKDKIKIYGYNIKDRRPDTAFFEQKVSIYNQLKRIYDNQGDIVEATWYHSKAMDNQERLLKEKYKKEGGNWFGEQNFDLFTFRLNKLTNNHGESWRKALRFILLSSFVMYCLYYLSLHYREAPSLQATDRFVMNYFLFLDPTHKIEFLVGKKALWWLPVFIDFFGRILMGYGIFQFISAFRRHGRRSG